MCSRVLIAVRATVLATIRHFSFRTLRLLESDAVMSYRRGGGYGGRRGRGPNRGGGRGSGSGGDGGDGAWGQGPPPPGLRGRALGMWYASRSRAQKKKRERSEVRVLLVPTWLKSPLSTSSLKPPLCQCVAISQ